MSLDLVKIYSEIMYKQLHVHELTTSFEHCPNFYKTSHETRVTHESKLCVNSFENNRNSPGRKTLYSIRY